MRMLAGYRCGLAVALLAAIAAPADAALPPKASYESAMSREKAVRAQWTQAGARALPAASLEQARAVVISYEAIVRRYPTSGYCDNALWQAAVLEMELFARVGQESDRQKAIRLFEFLAREYPSSPFARNASTEVRKLRAPAPPAPRPVEVASAERKTERPAAPATDVVREAPAMADPAPTPATITEIKRTILPEIVRVEIALDRHVAFQQERVENPPRLLFDLSSTRAAVSVQDANWSFDDDVVRKIRVGRHPNQVTRVVLDLEGVGRYSVVALDDPYRILIDCERQAASAPVSHGETPARVVSERPPAVVPAASASAAKTPAPPSTTDRPMPATPTGDRNLSMARQLGLGVSRIVIDPGHGGHDPGADGPAGTDEADIVLDIALRLEKLLAKQGGIEVILTRRTDVFVPLEERTAMANREQADLFLSIHANASRNRKANGIESYYLNFATTPDAEEVAARENAASARTMNSLPTIVKAIAMNNKLDESKDFAGLVQQSLAKRLRSSNSSLRNLGVKQAPFVVLIGAAMPSVLAEVSFLTHKREGQLLRSTAYRQKIAEALSEAVVRYRKTLKGADALASLQ